MPDLLQHFQVLRYDTRGHGASDVPPGDYTLEQLGRDVLGLVDGLNLRHFSWCGLSMGGATALGLAEQHPERVDSIIVCETTDPSWASVLFLASAFVVDIGGLLSHAAVVARELGVPCVMGTGNGTRVLRTGDRIRVNGNDGSVEILERA